MAENPNATLIAAAIQGAGEQPPKAPPLSPIPPLTGIGFDLAKKTMGMIAGAILILVLLLSVTECREEAAAADANAKLSALITQSATMATGSETKPVADALRKAGADKTALIPVPILEKGQALITIALANPATTPEQREALDKKCLPLPAPDIAERAAILEKCASTLEAITPSGGASAQSVTLVAGLQKSIGEERAAYRAFWLQVAQLVLINLLLPILTALLGYIFGTQQGRNDGGS